MFADSLENRNSIISNAMVDISNLPEKEVKNIELSATSQFVTGGEQIPSAVRYHICGLTAPYMAIKFLSLENGYSEMVPSFSDYIATAISQTSINCAHTVVSQNISNRKVNVPIYYSSESDNDVWNKSVQIVNDLGLISSDASEAEISKLLKFVASEVGEKRVRGFSINTGWDTGGTSQLLANLDLSEKILCTPRACSSIDLKTVNESARKEFLFSELKQVLNIKNKEGFNAVASVSINTKTPNWSRYYGDYTIEHNYTKHTVQSHVVMVVGISENNVLFLDPAGKSNKDIIQYMDIRDFKEAYNGIHTLFESLN